MKGPKITVKKSCFQCEYCRGESYEVQGDSGTRVFCVASDPRRRIGDTTWTTPEWCPLMAESADPRNSRITELEARLKEAQDFIATLPGGEDWLAERQIPCPMSTPDALLVGAKREALEAAADQLESEGMVSVPDSLRQMAREVKP